MFAHLLVAVDGSRHVEAIIDCAVRLARQTRAEITLVRVVAPNAAEVSEWGAMGPRPAHRISSRVAEAEAYVDRMATRLAATGMRVHTDVREGDPAGEILQAADDCGADTIIIANPARRGIERMLGGVTERIVHSTHLPVLLLSERAA